MADKAKLLLIVLIVLMVVSLGLAGVLFFSLQKEQTTRLAIQEELNVVTAARKSAELKVEEGKKTISELENKINDSNSKIESLSKELEQQKTDNENAAAEIKKLQESLEQQKTLRSVLEEKAAAAQQETKKIQGELKKLQSLRDVLESKIKELEKSSEYVELGKIVVTPDSSSLFGAAMPETVEAPEAPNAAVGEKTAADAGTKVQPAGSSKPTVEKAGKVSSLAADGKVLVVNRDYNFAVINLGSKDGVSIGNEFSVYHNDKDIGVVKVEKVHDSMAAAGFVSSDIKNKISEGDRVVRKK